VEPTGSLHSIICFYLNYPLLPHAVSVSPLRLQAHSNERMDKPCHNQVCIAYTLSAPASHGITDARAHMQVVTRTGSTLRDGALFIRMAALARTISPEVARPPCIHQLLCSIGPLCSLFLRGLRSSRSRLLLSDRQGAIYLLLFSRQPQSCEFSLLPLCFPRPQCHRLPHARCWRGIPEWSSTCSTPSPEPVPQHRFNASDHMSLIPRA
jgi:hypothetical protein